jgi:hypothetical protein
LHSLISGLFFWFYLRLSLEEPPERFFSDYNNDQNNEWKIEVKKDLNKEALPWGKREEVGTFQE